MEATSFKNLISSNNPCGIKEIVIPRIQRAYAQGRSDAHAVKTRNRFLTAIHKGLVSDGLTLDFIYGNVSNGCLIPLDGQQRLTTLWLLHWYANKKQQIGNTDLANFSYNTRYSARDFLKKLVAFEPSWETKLSEEICNQGWFPMEWMNDPTVSGMLTMLDEINERFADIDDLWSRLDKVSFYFRNIQEMKLTDDIYIKMNSRGKPLTDFEHFKAELLKVIRNSDPDDPTAKRIGLKIDREWTDLLWKYRTDEKPLIDQGFLRYFRLISLILIYNSDASATEFNLNDDFDLLDRIYNGKPENITFFEKSFDCLVALKEAPAAFFGSYLSEEIHELGKVVLPQQIGCVDLFQGIINGVASNSRPLYWVTLFFAFLVYLNHREEVKDDDFRHRLRVVVNLLKNSQNEVVDNPKADSRNRIPAILCQVESIILHGKILEAEEIYRSQPQNFNVAQLDEERQKLTFTDDHPEYAPDLYELEDYYLLHGRVAAVGYENHHLYKPFINLFNTCSRDMIDCAMLAIGDYSQRLNYWCIQLGSGDEGGAGKTAWDNLFHPSGQTRNFENTKAVLQNLLERNAEPDDAFLKQITDDFIEECKANGTFDWRYYYVANSCFRAERYGRYTMYEELPYELVAIYAAKYESSNAWQCFLNTIKWQKSVEEDAEFVGIRALTYKDGLLQCKEDAFVYCDNDEVEIARFIIPQNEEGIDTVDRIQYFHAHQQEESAWTLPEPPVETLVETFDL